MVLVRLMVSSSSSKSSTLHIGRSAVPVTSREPFSMAILEFDLVRWSAGVRLGGGPPQASAFGMLVG